MSEREAEALAGVDLVGSEFLRTRPRIVGVGLPLFFAAVLASGADARQVAALGAFSTLILGAFVLEAAYARRRRLTTRWLHRSLAATALAIAFGAWLSGGVTSPILPMLFAPTVLQLVAFGRRREAWVGAGLGVALAIALAIAPSPFAELPVHVRRAGTAMAVAVSLTLVATGATKLVAAYRDALVEIGAQRAREVAASQARARSLETIGAQLAHEIKNPLAGIEVMAGLLRRQLKDNAQATALVGDIISEAKMANAIVQEILDFVRPVRLQMERTSVAAALQAAVTMADGKAKRGHVDVSLAIDDHLPLIDADNTQLMQVFANLLINAFEALNGEGHVTVTAREVQREEDGALPLDGLHPMPTVVVEVTDDGPGVPPELADKIFSAFFTTKAQGSGLGLAIVRKIVDAHDGRIDMTSRPGAGTKFRVALPVSGDARVW